MSVLLKSIMTAEWSWLALMIILFTLKRFDVINTLMLCAWICGTMFSPYIFLLGIVLLLTTSLHTAAVHAVRGGSQNLAVLPKQHNNFLLLS